MVRLDHFSRASWIAPGASTLIAHEYPVDAGSAAHWQLPYPWINRKLIGNV
jgi:hypothetical protein